MDQTNRQTIAMAVVQAAAIPGDPQQNLKTIRTFSEKAAAAGCRAVCFPEGFLTGYDPDNAAQFAIASDDPVLKEVSKVAEALQIDILAGYMERMALQDSSEAAGPKQTESAAPKYSITHAVFYPNGRVLPCRKTHLGEKEQSVFEPGNVLQVFPLSCGIAAALQICVECHFPEITQTLSLQGAQVVFAPFASPGTPEERRRIWQTIIPARAYDNRVVMACCNLPGIRPSAKPGDPIPTFTGGCFACGPEGDVLAEDFGGSPGLCIFDVDPAQLALYRTPQPSMRYRYFPAKRRPELYTAQQPVACLLSR